VNCEFTLNALKLSAQQISIPREQKLSPWGSDWGAAAPSGVHYDRKVPVLQCIQHEHLDAALHAPLVRARHYKHRGIQPMLFVQVQIIRPIECDHPTVLQGDANPLVRHIAGTVPAAHHGDAAPAQVDVVPLLGEQALVDAVEQDAAVLERHGRATQQHAAVEWRRAGEENPLARDIPARVVVLGFLGRRREAGLGRRGGGPGGEGGGDRGRGRERGGAYEREGGGEAGEEVRERGARGGEAVRAVVVVAPPPLAPPEDEEERGRGGRGATAREMRRRRGAGGELHQRRLWRDATGTSLGSGNAGGGEGSR